MQSRGFNLWKWTCNDSKVITHLPDEIKASEKKVTQKMILLKVLRLLWDSFKDA